MAKQDEWSRITLRLPAALHGRLVEVAAAKSLNAEIVDRLERTFELDDDIAASPAEVMQALMTKMDEEREERRAMSEAILGLSERMAKESGQPFRAGRNWMEEHLGILAEYLPHDEREAALGAVKKLLDAAPAGSELGSK